MAKLTLQDIVSGFKSLVGINSNFAAIEQAIENTLSRDGTAPNAMSADLDLNTHRIINLAPGSDPNDAVNKHQLDTLSISETALAILAQRVALLLDDEAPPLTPILVSGQSLLTSTWGTGNVSLEYTATGGLGAPYTWSLVGAPAGVVINPNSGLIGILPNVDVGSHTFQVKASDINLNEGTRQVTLTVTYETLALSTPTSLPAATIGTPYQSGVFTLTGGAGFPYPEPQITSGSLPTGLSVQAQATPGTYRIVGTPTGTVTAPTTRQFTITFTSSDNQSISYAGTMTILPETTTEPTLTVSYPSAPFYQFQVGQAMSGIIPTITGGVPPYSAVLPAPVIPGFSIDQPTGIIQGTPTTYGTFTQTVRVTDSAGTAVTTSLPIIAILPATITLTVPAIPNVTEEEVFPPMSPIIAAGGTTSAFTLVDDATGTTSIGTTGLTITPDSGSASNRTWRITGTAAASSAGTYNVRFKLTDTDSQFGNIIYVNGTLIIEEAVGGNLPPAETVAPQNIAFVEGTAGSVLLVASPGDTVPAIGTQQVLSGTVKINGVSRSAPYSDTSGARFVDPEADPFFVTYDTSDALPPGVTVDPFNDLSFKQVGVIISYNGTGAVSTNTSTTGRFIANYEPETPPPGGGGGDPTEANASWTRRTTVSGSSRILTAFRFDTINEINPPGTTSYPQLAKETNPGNGYQAGMWAHDTTVKVSGFGSLRLELGANTQSASLRSYIDNTNRTQFSHVNSNNEYFLQFLWRCNEDWLKHYHLTSDGTSGSPKMCIVNKWDSTYSPFEIVLMHHRQWGVPAVYISNGNAQLWGGSGVSRRNPLDLSAGYRFMHNAIDKGTPSNPTTISQLHERFGPDYSNKGVDVEDGYVSVNHLRTTYVDSNTVSSGTITFEPDQWYVFEMRAKFNSGTLWNNIFQLWGAKLGDPPKMIISSDQVNYNMDGRAGSYHDGFHLTTYLTNKLDESGSRTISPYVWYDEVITSRDPIPFPRYGTGSDYAIPANDLTTFYTF